MKDIKYLTAYAVPLCALIALQINGFWAWLTPIYAFVAVPILESIFPVNDHNIAEEEKEEKKTLHWTDFLLYLNIPIVFGIVFLTLTTLTSGTFTTSEIVGLIFSCGIVIGSNGINVAHELGHRKTKVEQLMGKLLLLPALYMHFFVEHNFGHHLKAATPEDPATAKYNQSLYAFWISSIYRQYTSAWSIQMGLLKRENRSFLSYKNDMLWYHLIQAGYLLTAFLIFGGFGLAIVFFAAVSGFLLLETINYIEHYGLRRKKTASGRYERVREVHSWNSNHVFGRIMLYELTRHSDHHYRANKKYQLLDYHDVSPQLPYGYPTSMVISLFPPLWFKIMNKRVPKDQVPE
ncbi:alkane 1-monooxygenase [Dokdonia sinensis]|uniref:Alkane 1-monooxygenase n=1 Tax=Dokdonia sinensis TaxID=2479847 RepID=A0A3M0GF39_9FLAO|nr:alkane 1-monooxygenase [Dokdonia sinensis]RMB63525.1 alkane 1-monooxygenase [Dokdonia sinensis]